MNVKILATGSSGNSIFINDSILIDAGITTKAFLKQDITCDSIRALLITHRHSDHMNKAFVRYLLKHEVPAYLPNEVIAELIKEGHIDMPALLNSGQVHPITAHEVITVDDMHITPYPQKHHDIINFAFTVSTSNTRLLYATDLDTVEPTADGVGLLGLGQFDIILLEGNYDEVFLREYLEYMVSLAPSETNPDILDNEALDKWVRVNYRLLPQDVARNAFRAIQNHRHLSKQQARTYCMSALKPNGRYYEIHRSSQFYEAPVDWYQKD